MKMHRTWFRSLSPCREPHHHVGTLVAPMLSWFTEGFDPVELIEAKHLLDVLSAEMSPPTT